MTILQAGIDKIPALAYIELTLEIKEQHAYGI